MKQLIALFSTTAALGTLAISAGAFPDGYESFNIQARFDVQRYDTSDNSYKLDYLSFSTKDLKYLIGLEYHMTLPDNSVVALYGLGTSRTDQVAVLSSTGSVLIANASFNSSVTDLFGCFYLPDRHSYTETHSANTYRYNYVSDCGDFCYHGPLSGEFINLKGPVDFSDYFKEGYYENYNMPSSAGQFHIYLNSDLGYGSGNTTGSIFGSGRDINYYNTFLYSAPPPPL